MSATIWYEEVALAFKSLVETNMKYLNKKVEFIVRNPEEQLAKDPPCVTLYHYDEKFDRTRYVEGETQIVETRDLVNNTVQVEDNALPYNLYVQIDLWGTTQKQVAELTKQWCVLFDSKGYFDIKDSGGTVRSCTVIKKGFHKAEEINEDKRVYQRTYSYLIWVEIDEQIRKTSSLVTKSPRISLKTIE